MKTSAKDKEPYFIYFFYCFPGDNSFLEAINCAVVFLKGLFFGESDSYEEGSHLWIALSSPVVREELCLTVQNWSALSSTSAETRSLILWSASEPAKCLSYHPKLSPPLQNRSKEDGFCVTISLLSFEMCFFFLILCYHWFCDSTSSIFCILLSWPFSCL